MPLLPNEAVRAYVAEEMEAAQAWAERRGYELAFDEDAGILSLPMTGPAGQGDDPERYQLMGKFEDYRAVPPAWWFAHPDTGIDIGPPAYPKEPSPHPRGSGLFIGAGPTGALICAQFNRLAFAENGGVHADWGAQTAWLNAPASNYTRAETIGDMLARIELEVLESEGRMAPLP